MHPAVCSTLERVVPPGGARIGPYSLKGGTCVGISPFVFHKTEGAYGKDASIFRPERWIEAEGDEELKSKLDRNFLAFGGGTRVCIGRHISLMELTKVLPLVLSRYKFSFPQGSECEEAWNIEGGFFADQRNFFVAISSRPNHHA